MNKRHLNSNELRVISIGKEAVEEWLFESMIEHGTKFFGIKDITKVTFHCVFDSKTGQFTCAVLKRSEVPNSLYDIELNWDEVQKRVGLTTSSLFFGPDNKKLYKSLNFKKIPELLEVHDTSCSGRGEDCCNESTELDK